MWARVRSWLGAVLRRDRLETDLSDELEFHLQLRTDHWVRQGLTRQEAARRARLEFGGIDKHTEACRESLGLRLLDEFRGDVRYAVRQLRRTPTFAFVAIATLALAIGANAAIFSLVNAVLLKRLPVASPQELRQIAWVSNDSAGSLWRGVWYNGNATETTPRAATSFSYRVCDRIRRQSASFSSVLCLGHVEQVNIGAGGRAVLGQGQLVPGNFFGGLGVTAAVGRTIDAGDDAPGRPPVAVLGYGFWERVFGTDRSVIGKTIAVNGATVTVVGVAAPGFFGIRPGTETDVFLPLVPMQPLVYDEPGMLESARHWGWLVLARLKPGVSDEQARGETEALLRAEVRDHPPDATVTDLPRIRLDEAGRGSDQLRGRLGQPLRVLMLIVAGVLLIACANIAGLVLTRMSARHRETATRLAIGASRGRLARQVATECMVLAVIGGSIGIGLALGIRRALPPLLSEGSEILHLDLSADWVVIAFSTIVCLVAGLACGLLPALRVPQTGLAPIIARTASSITSASPRSLVGRTLVVVQVSVSIVLLVGAGLFVKTLLNLRSEALGFTPDHLLVFEMNGTLNGLKDTRLKDLYERTLNEVARLPGVKSASLSRWGLLSGNATSDALLVPGLQAPIHVDVHLVLPGYFKTMGIPVLVGRDISWSDREQATPVIIVNQLLARQIGGASSVGRTVQLGDVHAQIVGIVGDARFAELRAPARVTVYVPFRQHGEHVATFVLRTAGDPANLIPIVEKTLSRSQPDVPISNLRTQDAQIDTAVRQERLFANLVSGFAVLAALLACLGIYGTLASSVSRRTPEIGLRVALGADRLSVTWLILRESIAPVCIGMAVGLLLAFWSTQLIASMLFGLMPRDAATFVAAASLLLASAFVAAWVPARRAARLDPMKVLRCE